MESEKQNQADNTVINALEETTETLNTKSGLNWKMFSVSLITFILGASLVATVFYYKEQQKIQLQIDPTQKEEVDNLVLPETESGREGVIPAADNVITFDSDVSISQYDHKNPSSGSNSRFWATPYFIVDNKLYYSVTASTSKELRGIDLGTFQTFGDFLYGKGSHDTYVMRGYMVDRHGVICDDRRLEGVDLATFQQIPESRTKNRYTAYAKDKNAVYLPSSYSPQNSYSNSGTACSVLEGADPTTFEVIAEYPYYAKDKNAVYYNNELIVGAKPNTFAVLDDDYSFDGEAVYFGTSSVGSFVGGIPEDFSGEVKVIREDNNSAISYFVFIHDSGGVDVSDGSYVNKNWSQIGYLLPHKNKIYFLNTYGVIQSLSLSSWLVESYDIPIFAIESGRSELNYLFAYKDYLYYLKGDNCNSYRASCDLSLYEYDLLSQTERLLAVGSKTRIIEGYDEERQELYLSYRDGDAGCWWSKYEVYNFATGQLNDVGSESGCGEDSEDTVSPDIQEMHERSENWKGSGLVGYVKMLSGEVVNE